MTSLLEDHQGRLWVGIDNTLWRYEKGTFSRIDRSDGSRMGLITGITEDVDHNIWVEANRPPRTLFASRSQGPGRNRRSAKYRRPYSCGRSPRRYLARSHEWRSGSISQGKIEVFHFEHDPDAQVSQLNQLLVNPDWCGTRGDGLRPDRMEGRKTANPHRPERASVRWCQCARDGRSGSAVVVHAVWTRPDCTSGTATMVGPARSRLQLRTYDTFDGVIRRCPLSGSHTIL